MSKILMIIGLSFSLLGCSNAASVKSEAMAEGTERSFDAPYEVVIQAAIDGLAQLNLTPSERQNVAEGHAIMVARPPHGFSWGEVGRILVVRSDTKPTLVRVVYEKRTSLQFGGSSQSGFARNLFAKMDPILANKAR